MNCCGNKRSAYPLGQDGNGAKEKAKIIMTARQYFKSKYILFRIFYKRLSQFD